jgi:hypothetical protein
MRLLALLLVACTLAAPVAAQQLYRWTDDRGVVHYTDRPPPEGQQFETRSIVREPEAAPPAEAAPMPEANDTEMRCIQLRANLRVLASDGEVSMDLDGDGVPERLDADARARELERTREQLREQCADED